MTTQAAAVRIDAFYDAEDIDVLFDRVEYNYEKLHVSMFQSRKNVQLPEAIRLAMELPRGAFIAGGFMKSAIQNVAPKDYDIYFNSQDTLMALVRRIHNAPEGTFLHGYESDKSLRNLAESEDLYINFVHPTKPPLQLIRIRWFATPQEAIDKFDFRVCQFALDSDLNVIFNNEGIDDARHKRIYLNKVVFEISSSLRLKRLIDAGWHWLNGNYDSYWRDDMLRKAQDYLRKATRRAAANGQPAPQNVDGYASFES